MEALADRLRRTRVPADGWSSVDGSYPTNPTRQHAVHSSIYTYPVGHSMHIMSGGRGRRQWHFIVSRYRGTI